MKHSFGWTVSIVCALATVATFASSIVASATEHSMKKEHCSIAIFSKVATNVAHICDEQAVRMLAKDGQVYEQNQLGIASILGKP